MMFCYQKMEQLENNDEVEFLFDDQKEKLTSPLLGSFLGKMAKAKKNPNEKLTVTAFSLRPGDLYHLERMAKENKSRFIRSLIEDEWQRQSAKETK